jgi:hypothetical protein
MFSLRFGSSHVSVFNCIYKIIEHKVKINVLCPALRHRYHIAIADAVADLGSADVGQRLPVPRVDQPHPVPAKSAVLRVTSVKSCCSAVAASRLSTAGKDRPALPSRRPQRSAVWASTASRRPKK